jgi:hypothetical protein
METALPMPCRLLNIASAVCLVACVALMGLWARSYYWMDEFGFNPLGVFWVGGGSAVGRVAIGELTDGEAGPAPSFIFSHRPVAALGREPAATFERWSTIAGLGIVNYADAFGIMMPYWFVVLVSGSLAMALRMRWPWRFNLRGLFIVMTFLAVVLGMIAWLDRAWIGK